MIKFSIQAILLDVEGTTSSIEFVYQKMFPYARRVLRDYLIQNTDDLSLSQTLDLLAADAGFASTDLWFASRPDTPPAAVVADFAENLMDSDSKATGLKSLQGLLWKSGFESGQLQSHLFDDVAPALKRWHAQGIQLAIYSSGSVTAQKLFFGHTIAGNLNDYFVSNFDTMTGQKRSKESYEKIANALKLQTCDILFLSDVAEELAAAHAIGMQVAAVSRPGNAPIPQWYFGPTINSFDEISIF